MWDWPHSSWVDNCISRAILANWRKRWEVGQAARKKTSQTQNVNPQRTALCLTPQKVGRGKRHAGEHSWHLENDRKRAKVKIRSCLSHEAHLQTQKWAAVGIKLNESMMKEEIARLVDMCSSLLPQVSTSCTLQDISATVQPARKIHIIWEMPWKEVWTWTKSTAVERETVNANKKANFCWMIQWGITLKLLWGLQEQILLLVLGWKSSVLLTSPAQVYPQTLSCTLARRKIWLKSCTWVGGSRDEV